MARSTERILSGDWAISSKSLEAFAHDVRAAAAADAVGQPPDRSPQAVGESPKVALVAIKGPMVRSAPDWLGMLVETADTAQLSAAIEDLALDDSVAGIVLDVDSPGGQVSGTDALGRSIAQARRIKPVVAYVSGSATSAAYWVASQATEIVAERTAALGSIGVYSRIVDSSGAAEAAGHKVHVVSSGPLKGLGVDGAPVDQAAIEAEQDRVNALAQIFIGAVAEGRGMDADRVAALATGGTWLAEQAVSLGLADKVGTFKDAVASALKGEDMTEQEVAEEVTEESAEETPQAEDAQAPEAEATEADAVEPEAAVQDEDDELEQLRTDLAAAKQQIADIRASQRAQIISDAQAQGRVTPNLLSSVEAFAETCGEDIEKLRAFVGALPSATKPEASGEVAATRPVLSEAQLAFAKRIGMTPEEFARGLEE